MTLVCRSSQCTPEFACLVVDVISSCEQEIHQVFIPCVCSGMQGVSKVSSSSFCVSAVIMKDRYYPSVPMCKTVFGSYIRVIELIDSSVLFMADSTVYIAKDLLLKKLVMSVNGHYIIRF